MEDSFREGFGCTRVRLTVDSGPVPNFTPIWAEPRCIGMLFGETLAVRFEGCLEKTVRRLFCSVGRQLYAFATGEEKENDALLRFHGKGAVVRAVRHNYRFQRHGKSTDMNGLRRMHASRPCGRRPTEWMGTTRAPGEAI